MSPGVLDPCPGHQASLTKPSLRPLSGMQGLRLVAELGGANDLLGSRDRDSRQ